MYRVTCEIEGIAPFLFNRPEDERKSTGNISDEERKQRAIASKVHKNGHGLFIPAWNLKVSLLNGAKNCLKRANSINDLVKAAVFPKDALFGKEEPDFIHEVWGRVPPRTGALVKVWRPALHEGWTADITFDITDERLKEDALRLAWENTGLMIGVGSWRPEFGRFLVKNWTLQREKKAKKA